LQLPVTDDYSSIIIRNTPLIDVRAPVEFAKGAFPGSVNLPLLLDDERRDIGIAYKDRGKEYAIDMGYRLISGEIKEKRVQGWMDFIKKNPDSVLYCFRGGKRSQISQQWILEAGGNLLRLGKGYKGFRGFLLQSLENPQGKFSPLILGGRTGSGKTLFLQKRADAVDLEKLAHHRGSSFGRHIHDQPTQINFENALAYRLIQLMDQKFPLLLFEDEGRNVGRLYLPPGLFEYLSAAPLAVLETPMEERVDIIFQEYVTENQQLFLRESVENYPGDWYQSMVDSLDRIQKRLGGDRHKMIKTILQDAFQSQIRTGDLDRHREWIRLLLEFYYDPMYDYQLSRKTDRIVFHGNVAELEDFLSVFSFTN